MNSGHLLIEQSEPTKREIEIQSRCGAILAGDLEPIESLTRLIADYDALALPRRQQLAAEIGHISERAKEVVAALQKSSSTLDSFDEEALRAEIAAAEDLDLDARLAALNGVKERLERTQNALRNQFNKASAEIPTLHILEGRRARLENAPLRLILPKAWLTFRERAIHLLILAVLGAIALTIDSATPQVQLTIRKIIPAAPVGSAVLLLFLLQTWVGDPLFTKIRRKMKHAHLTKSVALIRESVTELVELEGLLIDAYQEVEGLEARLSQTATRAPQTARLSV